MSGETPRRPTGRLLGPWLWLLLIAALFSMPLLKSLGAEYPDPLPGMDRVPSEFTLKDERGEEVSLSDLTGHLVVLSELPLANGTETETVMRGMRALRKRLRGLGSMVVFCTLAHGGDAARLSAVLDEWTARKPVNVFLLDPDRETLEQLRFEARSPSADFLLFDRHGRLRGVYGMGETLTATSESERVRIDASNRAEMDRLVHQAGQRANWAASDLPPEEVAEAASGEG